VLSIRRVPRRRLFPDEPENAKSKRWYHQLILAPLKRLPQPIFSRRFRRIVFIPTTWQKLIHAVEINDLYDGSPLEDRLWAMLKRVQIGAERQYYVEANRRRYALDFAVFCNEGKIDIETDGDTWHARPDRIPLDNQRQNDLTAIGWHTLRFNTAQVLEGGFDETIPPIMQAVNRFGGLTSDGLIPRPFTPSQPAAAQQLTLFEAGPEYDVDI
jgi:very-short-patch-repair endonuclease